MNKTGNQHSSLLDSLLKSASAPKKEPQCDQFANKLFNALKTKQQTPSLRQVLAQFEDPALTEPAPAGGDLPDAGLQGELPDEGMPDEGMGTPDLGSESCDPELKEKIKDAFIAACGGLEQARQALDEGGEGEMPDPEMGDMEPDLGEEGLPTPEVDEPEMPAPMPMGGGAPAASGNPAPMTQPF